ncbi:MAG: hypothetical protein IPL38_08755 [Rhodobacter sp.]|nr:hypothetical protein [Rhodobacter sp.]
MIGQDDGMHAAITLSGFVVDGYNVVGPFGVGFELLGMNMSECHRVAALKDAGFGPKDPDLDASLHNQAVFQFLLKTGSSNFQTGNISVRENIKIRPNEALSYTCNHCQKVNRIFEAYGAKKRNPFVNEIVLHITCSGCQKTFSTAAAKDFVLSL